MHCHICDNMLDPKNIIFNKEINTFEICPNCLSIALEAAFTGDFSPDNMTLDDPDFVEEFGEGVIPTLDSDVYTPYVEDLYVFGHNNYEEE